MSIAIGKESFVKKLINFRKFIAFHGENHDLAILLNGYLTFNGKNQHRFHDYIHLSATSLDWTRDKVTKPRQTPECQSLFSRDVSRWFVVECN
jgi:hypothetical protein